MRGVPISSHNSHCSQGQLACVDPDLTRTSEARIGWHLLRSTELLKLAEDRVNITGSDVVAPKRSIPDRGSIEAVASSSEQLCFQTAGAGR